MRKRNSESNLFRRGLCKSLANSLPSAKRNLLAAISDYSVRLDPMDTTVSRSCRLSPADPIYFPLGLTAKEQHLLIAPDTQHVSIGDTDGILRAGRGGGEGEGEGATARTPFVGTGEKGKAEFQHAGKIFVS